MRVASQDALEPSHLVAVSWCFRVVALRTEKRAGAWTGGLLGEPLAPHAQLYEAPNRPQRPQGSPQGCNLLQMLRIRDGNLGGDRVV